MPNCPAILIVTHNHLEYIDKLIESCLSVPEFDVYICDAASSDGTPERIRHLTKETHNIRLFEKKILESFSKNNNDLLRIYSLQDRAIVLLNPDCYFKRDSFIRFISIAESIENLGILAPKICNPDGSTQYSWRKFPSPLSFITKRLKFSTQRRTENFHRSKIPQNEALYKIDWALGAILYIAPSLNNKNKILDERYRLYCEDADICFKAHDTGKLVCGVVIEGFYHHLQQKSTALFSKYSYWNISSAIKFALKWNLKYLINYHNR